MKRHFSFCSRFRILKGGKISLVISAMLGSTTLSFAAPSGGTVTSGSATISKVGNITNIKQSTNKATINWQNFSIGENETVNFKQPNVNSITLNRVIGTEKSVINGALNANGQVWLLNSNGVLFGNDAAVNTSGLLTTTAQLNDEDFNAGNYNFKDATANSIINKGNIEVINNGSVIFASNEVANQGTIKAIKGNIQLVGSDSYSIILNGNTLVDLTVDKGVLDAMVSNSGTILADGGKVYLTTNAINELLKSVVNNTGIIEANSIDDLTGHIELFAHGGEAQIDGKITAENGFIETSGKDFTIEKTAQIKAKKWLIDPINLVVNDATAYETALENGTDTTIQTDNSTGTDEGNIYIEDTINWTSTAKLTLDSYNDIYINADISTSQGSLVLHYGQGSGNSGNTSNYYINNATINLSAGNNFFTKLGNDGTETSWTVITDLGVEGSTTGTDLQGINGNLSGNYVLGADIIALGTSSWNSGQGWEGIGDGINIGFSGNFDGLGHTISDIYINRNLSTQYYFGLFDYVSNATIKNLTLENFEIVAENPNGNSSSATATLAGRTSSANIYNINVINSMVSGRREVGGIIGTAYNTDISNSSFVNGSVDGAIYNVGGIVGVLYGDSILKNSYSDTTVTGGNENTGGLVGRFAGDSIIENSYAKGSVSGDSYVGGLVGKTSNSTVIVRNSYSSNTVSGNSYVGGVIGDNTSAGSIIESYYDSDVNTSGILEDLSLGRTQQDIKNLVINGTWDNTVWGAQDSDFEGYAIGTSYTLPELQAFYDGATLFTYGYGTTTNPFGISNWTQLQNINYNTDTLSGGYYYTLTNDLTTSLPDYTSMASSSANSGAGWYTIGDENSFGFTGNFDGQEHIIDGLYMNSSQNVTGLFGYTSNATISNVALTNVDISGLSNTGSLVGLSFDTIVTNSYSTGRLDATGQNFGGLVGQNSGNLSEINYSYSSVDVSGSSSSNRTGGLVGWNIDGASIKNSYSTGNVSAGNGVGGLLGSNENGSLVENSYSTGNVSGTGPSVGGLIGWASSNSSTNNSFWNLNSSGRTTSAGGTGLTSTQMSYGGLFYDVGWDIVADNNIISSTPVLKYDGVNDKYVWAVAPLELTYNLGSKTTTYDGTTQSLSDFYTSSSSIFGNDYSFINMSTNDYIFQVNGTNVIGYKNAGTYSDIKLALTNSNSFLTLSNTGNGNGTLTINKANATVTADSNVVTYNGTSQSVNGYTVIGLVNNETSSVLDEITGDSASGVNAGTYNTSLSGADDNYNLTFINGQLIIRKKSVIIMVNPNTVTYNGLAQSSSFTATGLVNGETESVLDGVSVSSATNAGTYTLTASGTDENYNLVFGSGQLIIQKANATVTAGPETVTYNGKLHHASAYSVTGLVNGENSSVLDSITVTGSGTDVGTYNTSVTGTDNNYNLSFVDGTLTISANTDDVTKDYGSFEPKGPEGDPTGEGEDIVEPTLPPEPEDNPTGIKTPEPKDNPTETEKTSEPKDNPTETEKTSEPKDNPTETEKTSEPKDNPTETEKTSEPKDNPTKTEKTSEPKDNPTETEKTSEPKDNPTKTEKTSEPKENLTETKVNNPEGNSKNKNNDNSKQGSDTTNSNDSDNQNSDTEESNDTTNEDSLAKDEKKVVAENDDTLESAATQENIQLNDAQIEITVDENGNIIHSKSQIEVKITNDGKLIFGDNSSDVLETMGLAIKDIAVSNNKIKINIIDKKNIDKQNNIEYSASLANGDSLPANLIINIKTGKISGTLPNNTKEVEIFIKAIGDDNTVRIVGLKIKLSDLQINANTNS